MIPGIGTPKKVPIMLVDPHVFMFRVEASWFGEGGHWKESLEISLKDYTGFGIKKHMWLFQN